MTTDETTTTSNVVPIRRPRPPAPSVPLNAGDVSNLAFAALIGSVSSKKHCRRTRTSALFTLRHEAYGIPAASPVSPERKALALAAVDWITAGCEVCGKCKVGRGQ